MHEETEQKFNELPAGKEINYTLHSLFFARFLPLVIGLLGARGYTRVTSFSLDVLSPTETSFPTHHR